MERMEALFDATNNRADVPMTRDQLAEAMATCDVLVPTVTDVIDAGLIEGAGEQLRLLANYGAGIDHIALQAARARDLHFPHPPGVLTEAPAPRPQALLPAEPRRPVECGKTET